MRRDPGRARAPAPDRSVKDPGRISRVSGKGSPLVNAEARALNSSKRLEQVHARGWAPIEAQHPVRGVKADADDFVVVVDRFARGTRAASDRGNILDARLSYQRMAS